MELASTTRVHRVRVKPNASIPWVAGFQAESVPTCREQQIAVLAASGRPDAAISADLSISVRTVENHLSHIYRKLDVTSRRDLPDALMLGTEK
jgi:DNA-binding NarL/FixJ family response regulator